MADITETYGLKFPEATDSVNVHNDIKKLADSVETALESLDASNVRIKVINKTTENISGATPVYAATYLDGSNLIGQYDGRTIIKPFTSNFSDNYPLLGLTNGTINANGGVGEVVTSGVLSYYGLNTSSYNPGDILYVDSNGSLTTEAVGGAIGVVAIRSVNNGVIVISSKGNGTWGALKAGLA
jgi:hypothetical protein